MYYKNLDKNELEDQYSWVIFEKEEWQTLCKAIRTFSEKYAKLANTSYGFLTDYNMGVANGYKGALEIFESRVPF
jgi:hypothetical protein